MSRVAPHPKVASGTLAGALVTILTVLTGLAKHDPTLAAAITTLGAALSGYLTPSHLPPARPGARRRPPASKPHGRPLVMHSMFDTIEVGTVPTNPDAVAGYVGGHWPDYGQLVRRFPHAHHLSIAVDATENAHCLDIERGDATPEEAPAWTRRQHARGLHRPVLYTSVSDAEHLTSVMQSHGIPRDQYKLWTAHYDYHPHLCGPHCGYGFTGRADATQYTDRALGRNLDESLCATGFFE